MKQKRRGVPHDDAAMSFEELDKLTPQARALPDAQRKECREAYAERKQELLDELKAQNA